MKTSINRIPFIVKIFPLILIFNGTFLFLFTLFFKQFHSIDEDAFLYLGSKLLNGDLLYLHDFETKFPFVQYVFSLASVCGGIGAWRIMVFVYSVILSYLGSSILAKEFCGQLAPFLLTKNYIKFLLFGVFLSVVYSLPGGESSQLEIPAAASAYLSMALITSVSRKIKCHKLEYFLSGLLLSIATLLRPNYVYVFIFLLPVLFFTLSFYSKKDKYFYMVNFILGYVSFLIITFAPYFVSIERLNILYAALRTIFSFHEKTEARVTLVLQFLHPYTKSFYFASLLSIFVLISILSRIRGKISNIAFVGFVSVIALEISIFSTHYYTHYTIMFVAYIIPIFLAAGVGLVNNKLKNINLIVFIFFMSIVFLLNYPFYSLYKNIRYLISEPDRIDFSINQSMVDPVLFSYLKGKKEEGEPFLVVYKPIYHMLLNEPRIGDGHPIMIRDILSKKRIGPIADIYLYSDEVFQEPCLSLINSEKNIFIIAKATAIEFYSEIRTNGLVEHCLTNNQFHHTILKGAYPREYSIFIRRGIDK